jgi:predicted amidohydrolase
MQEFDEIYLREFKPIQARNAFRHMNLYAGTERMEEFDLASAVLMMKAGGTIHSLECHATADRTNTDLTGEIGIATFTSNRTLVHRDTPGTETEFAPFYLGKRDGHSSQGLIISSKATVENRYNQSEWIKKNQRAIDRALRKGANVICLGEFDFPPVDYAATFVDLARSEAANEKHRGWIEERLKKHGKPAIVFAGSSHQWTQHGCANIGEIFIADYNGNGAIHVHRQNYNKRVTAGGLGELLHQTTSPILKYFGTSLGKVACLICIDAFDPGVVMSLIASSRGIDRVGIVLVPSYNPSERLVRSCQQLSYHANCTVVYANSMETATHTKAQVFLSGIPLRTWHAQLNNIADMVNAGAVGEGKGKKKAVVKPDHRIVDGIPGVWSLARLVHLTEMGRGMKIRPLDGENLINWVIPHGFAAEAAVTMNEKYPLSRRRILASLASEDD